MTDPTRLYEAILNGDFRTAVAATQEAITEGFDPQELVSQQMIPAMQEVGRRFECNQSFVPELLIAARAMKRALELLRPLLVQKGAKLLGRVVIGTVKGDLHDIGKNLVGSMLEGGGFEVYDLGVDVDPEGIVDAIKEKNANIVCLSALLTTTMPSMQTSIEAINKAGLRRQVKVLVGGAPVTQQFADEIGADGYSDNANGAVTLARRLIAAQLPLV
jgi:5-methyltetrahydrofolate--homocysteine methyltransferase